MRAISVIILYPLLLFAISFFFIDSFFIYFYSFFTLFFSLFLPLYLILYLFENEGTRQLLEMAKTDDRNKCCIDMVGALHDIISNELTFVTGKCIEWIQQQLLENKISEGGNAI